MSSADAGGERTSAADLAASALLGALVWDPRRAHDLPWLRADDFWRPADAAVFATITGLVQDGRRADARTIEAALRAGEYHDVGGRVRDNPAVVLHTLLATTPATPAEPHVTTAPRSEHVRYGQLVLDDAIRRDVTAAGVRIGQTSREAVTVDHEAAADRIDEVLHDTVDRLQALTERHRSSFPGGLREGLTTTLRASDPAATPEQAAADRAEPGGSQRGPLRPREVLRAEQRLIGSCLSDPGLRNTALEHLRPTDFADPAAATTWAAITDLSRGGGPVDYVFVAAELERRAGHDPSEGIAPAQLRDLTARAIPTSGDLDTVARAALERIGQHTERDLTAVADDKVHRGAEVLDAARKTVESARQTARRVGGRSSTASPAGPASRAAPPAQRCAPDSPARSGPISPPQPPARETISPNPPPRRRS